MRRERRDQQAWYAAVLAVALMVSAALTAFLGVERVAPADLPQVAAVTAAVVPQSVAPVLPDARQIAKPSAGALFLLVAAVAALMLGVARRFSWSAAARTGSAAVPAAVLNAVRGRAPPRRSA